MKLQRKLYFKKGASIHGFPQKKRRALYIFFSFIVLVTSNIWVDAFNTHTGPRKPSKPSMFILNVGGIIFLVMSSINQHMSTYISSGWVKKTHNSSPTHERETVR